MSRLFYLSMIAGSVFLAASAQAATLLIHYDVNNPLSWNGSVLKDLEGFGSNLTPGAGNPRTDSSPNVVPSDFGAPVFVPSGATTSAAVPAGMEARDRAYLDFNLLGVLTGNSLGSSIFNTPAPGDDGTNANIAGYTLEMFLRVNTGYTAAENTGIGFSQNTSNENQFVRIGRGTNTGLRSNSQVDNTQGATTTSEQVDANINGIITRDQWLHLVKVHDPVSDQVRFYVNGVLQPSATVSLDPDSSAVEYAITSVEGYGNVGTAGRELRGIGYGMFRAYRGALSDAEILANFQQVAFSQLVPEPGSGVMLGMAVCGLLAARRRRRLAATVA